MILAFLFSICSVLPLCHHIGDDYAMTVSTTHKVCQVPFKNAYPNGLKMYTIDHQSNNMISTSTSQAMSGFISEGDFDALIFSN